MKLNLTKNTNNPFELNKNSQVRKTAFTFLAIIGIAFFTNAQYTPLTISSGYNADVIANGTGTAYTTTTHDVDGVSYAFYSNDFLPNGLPTNGHINSALTTGLTYQLGDYSLNNSLRLPSNQNGTLVLSSPTTAQSLYILGFSGGGSANMNVTITFADATTQTANGIAVADWYGGANVAHTGFWRVNRDNGNTDFQGNGPNLYQYNIPINVGNQSKTIESISFSQVSGGGILNIFAMSVKNYCTPSSNNVGDHGENFTTTNATENFIDNTNSAVPGGYGDFYSTHHVTQDSGSSFDFSVTFKGNNVKYAIWIDWNQNGVFESSERVFYQHINLQDPVFIGTIPILSSAQAGEYRMRVRGAYIPGSNEPDPCAAYDWGEARDYKLIVTNTAPCAGTPTAGTTVLNPNTGYPNAQVNGSITGASSGSGLTYQWQYYDGSNWVDIVGQTNASLITTAMSTIGTRQYRRAITCEENTAYSTPATYTTEEVSYCIPEGTNSERYINDFTTSNGSQNINNTGSGFSPGGYGDFTTMNVTQFPNETVNFTTSINGGTSGFRIWVDWNQNGVFEAGEVAYSSSSYATTHNGSFSIPNTAAIGETRMRVVSHWLSSTGDVDPCETGFIYGEFEDYKLTIVNPTPCSGTPVAGTVVDLTVCANEPFILSPDGVSTGETGLIHQWQESADGSTWINIPGANTASYTVLNGISTTTYYRLIVTCENGQETATTNTVEVSLNAPLSCYCTPSATNSNYHINNFTTSGGIQNITNNGTGFSTGGYGDFTSLVAEQIKGGNIDFAAEYATGNTFGFRIWVDWNQNGVFDAGEVAYSSSSYATSHNGSFLVPTDALVGTTRMRIANHYFNPSGNVDPCETDFVHGEFEDYSFIVTPNMEGPLMDPICQETTSPALGGMLLNGATSAIWTSDSGGTFSNNSGTTPGLVTWTPPTGFTGIATLTITATGGPGGTQIYSKTIEVTPAPPLTGTITETHPTTCEGDEGTITVEANAFWYKDDYSSSTPQIGSKSVSGGAEIIGGEMMLTNTVNDREGIMTIDNPGFNENQIKATFDMFIGGGTEGADGLKISYGDVTVWFDTYLNSTAPAGGQADICLPGENGPNKMSAISVLYNGEQLVCFGQQEIRNSTQNVEIYIDLANQLHLTVGTEVYSVSLAGTTYPNINKTTWNWMFTGRTGALNDQHKVDNVEITVYKEYEFSIDNTNWQESNTFTGLEAGTYTVYMRGETPSYCENSSEIGIVILDDLPEIPSASLATATTSICHGNTVELSGTVTADGAWTMEITPGNITVSGTGNGNWSETVTPSESTTYSINQVSTLVGQCTGDGTGTTAITLPTAGTTLAGNGESATCVVKNGERVHFYHSSGRLIATVEANSGDLGSVTATAYVDGAPQLTTACDAPSYVTSVMQRHWVISPTIESSALVYLPFENTELTNLISAANSNSNPDDDLSAIDGLKLSKYSGPNNVNDDWFDNCLGNGGNQNATIHDLNGHGSIDTTANFVNTISGGSYAQFNIPSFSEFWLHGSITTPLPVELTTFSASCEEGETVVTWTTASENNSDYFIVEKSRDGQSWTSIGERSAAGNSNTENSYSIVDENSLNGITYYRLKQVDYNGNVKIYGPISGSCSGIEDNISVYPNPNNGSFIIEITSTEKQQNTYLYMTDMTGKLVISQHVNILAGTNQVMMDNLRLATGAYLVYIKGGDMQVKPVKVVVQ